MSDTDDDIYAWANSPNANDNDDDDHQGGVISGGFDAGGAGRRTSSSRRRSSNRGGARTTPRYKDESSSEEEEEEEEEVEEVEEEEEEEENNVGGKERSSRRGTASSVSSSAGSKRNSPKTSEEGPAVVVSSGAVESEIDNDRSDGDERNEGIDVVIPYALLNKDRGAGRGECTVLVQVEPGGGDGNDGASSDRLDFHGQSGAVGRFEADGEGGACRFVLLDAIPFVSFVLRSRLENGDASHRPRVRDARVAPVILDFKGYQHRGTIRPGPTAMVVALTRDGQLKVEA